MNGEIQPLLNTHDVTRNQFPDDPDFNDLIQHVETAIDQGIFPQRITQGSSGSYYVKNCKNVSFFSRKFLNLLKLSKYFSAFFLRKIS